MQKLAYYKNKNIVVLGAGLTGLSCVRFLQKNKINCSVNDSRETPTDLTAFKENFPQVDLFTGSWNAELINKADVLLVSPGVDLTNTEINQYISKSCKVIGDVELFCQLTNTATIAVTGSNGKSTVVSLLHFLGNKLGYNTQLGGNIGVPVLDILGTDTFKDIHFLVLELSSFQLETLNSMLAKSATILNVSDDHLDRHKTLENYTAIKQKIYSQCNVAVINRDDKATYLNVDNSPEQVSFGSDKAKVGQFGLETFNSVLYLMFGNKKLIAVNELPLAGIHNALNYLAALALGVNAGWSLPLMVQNLAGFQGLAHRCQRIKSQDNVHWINDSKATNIGATLAAIKGLSETLTDKQNLILIAGGDGKGADFEPLRKPITECVSVVYTLGKDGDKLAAITENSIDVGSIEEAVNLAHISAKAGDIVLLSPACASIDMFKNFEERGKAFETAVHSVQEAC